MVVGYADGDSWLTEVGSDYSSAQNFRAVELFAPVTKVATGRLGFPGEAPARCRARYA